MNVFNEKDLVTLKVSNFKDDKGVAITPGAISAFWFRVDELASGQNQVPQTNVTPADPAYITVEPAQNVMIDATLDREIVAITYHFEWGANTGKTKTIQFQRTNLRFHS